MYERYSGSFLSVSGVEWKAMILQEADSEFAPVGGLTFVSGSEIEIEWPHKDKEEVVCGSTATVTLLSPGDRTYADLYTIAPGKIKLEVYRDGSLYWAGLLDPEFYEEPYAYGSAYAVTLTFSDFGILERLKYNLTGIRTINEVLRDTLSRSGLPYHSVNSERVSLIVPDLAATPALDALAVRSENWTDEDGETASLRDVIEGILQPLGLKMVQKAGTVYVYDINGLHNTYPHSEIVWAGDDQTLGVDKVANDVRIRFSPYAGGKLSGDGDIVDTSGDSEDDINLDGSVYDKDRYTYYKGLSSGTADPEALSFTIFLHKEGKLPYIHNYARYFHILPLLDGEESVGIANYFFSGSDRINGSKTTRQPTPIPVSDNVALFGTDEVYLPDLTGSGGKKPLLRITLPMLMDARYNPFEDDDIYDTEQKYLKNSTVGVFVPVMVRLFDESGNELYHYTNTDAISIKGTASLANTLGDWIPGTGGTNDCKLQYYTPQNIYSHDAVGGWKDNHHAAGLTYSDAVPSFADLDAGQYLPYPPVGGYLTVVVLAGFNLFTGADLPPGGTVINPKGDVRWMLFKTPVIELVNNNILHKPVSSDDVEYSGTINADAKDGIEIDTVCGTMDGGNPTAKGLYYKSNGVIVDKLIRGGRTERPEQLLIGTLYSQYAGRKTVLSGTARICPYGLRWYSDAAQGDREFMLLSEVQNLREDESVIEAAEFRPDEYKSSKE